jgi:sialic acid synthase SpsE
MTRFIAELGSNHNGDLQRALRLLEQAADAGAHAAKLQVFRVEDLFAPEALERHSELCARRAWELPLALLAPIADRCHALGMELGATPFGLWAVPELLAYVDFFKIASYELLWHELIEACAASGKPLVLSTGMATLTEVREAVAVARAAGAQPRVLHCVSGYPTPPEQANLAAIGSLREQLRVPVGWSDHTCSERVVHRAVRAWQASDIELHIDLDGEGNEAGAHNWTPRRLRALIDSLAAASEEPPGDISPEPGPRPHSGTHSEVAGEQEMQALDGDGIKRPMPVELPDVPWRADPADGLRPLRALRARFGGGLAMPRLAEA